MKRDRTTEEQLRIQKVLKDIGNTILITGSFKTRQEHTIFIPTQDYEIIQGVCVPLCQTNIEVAINEYVRIPAHIDLETIDDKAYLMMMVFSFPPIEIVTKRKLAASCRQVTGYEVNDTLFNMALSNDNEAKSLAFDGIIEMLKKKELQQINNNLVFNQYSQLLPAR